MCVSTIVGDKTVASASAGEAAKMCESSVFFRPWDATEGANGLTELSLTSQPVSKEDEESVISSTSGESRGTPSPKSKSSPKTVVRRGRRSSSNSSSSRATSESICEETGNVNNRVTSVGTSNTVTNAGRSYSVSSDDAEDNSLERLNNLVFGAHPPIVQNHFASLLVSEQSASRYPGTIDHPRYVSAFYSAQDTTRNSGMCGSRFHPNGGPPCLTSSVIAGTVGSNVLRLNSAMDSMVAAAAATAPFYPGPSQFQDFCYSPSVEAAAELIRRQDVVAKQMKKLRPKKFKCEHCDVAFSNNGQLKGHIRIHTGERPFKCDAEGCDKSFTRNEELTRHKRIHTGLRPHSCRICGKSFGRKDHLKKHMRTHESRDPYRLSSVALGAFGLIHPLSSSHHPAAASYGFHM